MPSSAMYRQLGDGTLFQLPVHFPANWDETRRKGGGQSLMISYIGGEGILSGRPAMTLSICTNLVRFFFPPEQVGRDVGVFGGLMFAATWWKGVDIEYPNFPGWINVFHTFNEMIKCLKGQSKIFIMETSWTVICRVFKIVRGIF